MVVRAREKPEMCTFSCSPNAAAVGVQLAPGGDENVDEKARFFSGHDGVARPFFSGVRFAAPRFLGDRIACPTYGLDTGGGRRCKTQRWAFFKRKL